MILAGEQGDAVIVQRFTRGDARAPGHCVEKRDRVGVTRYDYAPFWQDRYSHLSAIAIGGGAMRSAAPNFKSVLITGGTDGLGKAAAVLLAQCGYQVFAAGRSPQKRVVLDALARQKKLSLQTLQLDVCDDTSVQQGIREVLAKAGSIDVVINNAGVNYTATVEDLAMEDFRRQFEANFFGVLRVTRAVLPHMREKRRGRILMMSSVAGLVTPPTQGAYSASKHALEGVSNALRMELYSFGIDVVLIEPGYIVTGLQKASAELSKSYFQKSQASPYADLYGRFYTSVNKSRAESKTTPDDCARVILRAIEARRPKARYGVTPLATFVKWSKRLLSDGAFDGMMRRRYGIVREES
jgi:NAD(P)-dependent dehydrogenase (short-subunit alcohol dehydrogenase family)